MTMMATWPCWVIRATDQCFTLSHIDASGSEKAVASSPIQSDLLDQLPAGLKPIPKSTRDAKDILAVWAHLPDDGGKLEFPSASPSHALLQG